MRVFLTGATGEIGRRLVPRLRDRGHEVIGTARSAAKAEALRAQGATPVAVDLLDDAAVLQAVRAARPDAIVHEATALGGLHDLRHFDRSFAATNLLRTRGTDALLAAARAVGVGRLIAQSYAGWSFVRASGELMTEDDPLDTRAPEAVKETVAALAHLERAVLGAGGIVLRYGGFYGEPDDAQVELVRKRRYPIIGAGEGVLSLVHLDDAAEATVLALERGRPGVYNIVDDEPARGRDWLPGMAAALGARPPRRVPRWLARLLAGAAAVTMMTESHGASNAKARRELGWAPRYPSWRAGFPASYAHV